MARFRPSITALEDRRTPALSVLAAGGDLTVTGTPNAISPAQNVGWIEAVSVTRTTGNLYEVKDGPAALGTFPISGDLTLRFDSIDNDVIVDLNGGTLAGNLTVDLGLGDRIPTRASSVAVAGNGGQINGGVTFRGSSATEQFALGSKIFYGKFTFGGRTLYLEGLGDSPVTVHGDVSAVGNAVTNSLEDSFSLSYGSLVQGNVSTNRVTYTSIDGTVGGNVTALTHVPGGMGFSVYGEVGGSVYAEGSADTPGYYSYAYVGGQVTGSATIRITGGNASVGVEGRIGGNFNYQSLGDVSTSAYILNYEPYGTFGAVAGSATFNFFTNAGTSNDLQITGRVGGPLVVNDGAGNLTVTVGTQLEDYDPETGEPFLVDVPGIVGGGIFVSAGWGDNSFTFNGDFGSTSAGPVAYIGGIGSDTVSISGQNAFTLAVVLSGGDDAVLFAPDAKVKAAAIVYGSTGTKTWVPPLAIDFPLWLINY